MLDAPCPRLTLWDVDEPCVGARAHHRLMLQSGRCSSVGRGGMAPAATHGLEPNRCVAARPRAYGRRSRTSQVRRVETRERRAETGEQTAESSPEANVPRPQPGRRRRLASGGAASTALRAAHNTACLEAEGGRGVEAYHRVVAIDGCTLRRHAQQPRATHHSAPPERRHPAATAAATTAAAARVAPCREHTAA